MSFQKYPNYKSSGFDWLGDVPQHWELKRLSHYFEERREKVSDLEYEPLSVTKQGIVPRLETAAKTQDGDNRKKVLQGDFVINSRSDRKGSSGLSKQDGSVSLICTVLKPFNIHGGYIHHLFRSEVFQEEYYRWGKGIVADLWSTNFSDMKNIVLGLPPESEQFQIARFLDHETAKIDALIEQQQRLIELLKEKRQAVISHAVTKGLDPKVPMKDSGVEWLGEVPAHWRLLPLKYICRFSGGGTPSKENVEYWNGEIPWVSPKDMKSFWLMDTIDKITLQAIEDSSTNLVQPGALLMVVRSGILQRTIPVAINEVAVSLNQDMKALRFQSANVAEFFALLIKGNESSCLLALRKQGATVESIEHEYLASLVVPLPPETEIDSILNALGHEEKYFEELEEAAKKSSLLLFERRSALISAAVTGKIDVRNWQPPASDSQQEQQQQQERAHG